MSSKDGDKKQSASRNADFGSIVINRRRFVAAGVGALLAGGAVLNRWKPALAAKKVSDSLHGPLIVTDIESHEITLPYHDWIHYQLQHFYGPQKRTIYVVHTNKGITGLGDAHGSGESKEVVEKYIGSNPFDWIGDETSLHLGTAMYDIMGKAARVPVYRLFGQKYRSWVPVGSWTVSTHPKRMAEAVERYAAAGYRWMKYHLSPFENVIDQMEAMQAVAPSGFKIMHDVTGHGTVDHMVELIEKISKYPIAGAFEDPLMTRDIQSYVELRQRSRLPIVLHHTPLAATFEVLMRAADAYILGHWRIGNAVDKAGLFAAANVPFMLQNVGTNITRAMTTHMQAAFPTASFHFHSDKETWKADPCNEKLEPINGFLRVPEKPGLGVSLNYDELNRLKKLKLPEQPKWIIKTRFANGTMMYNIADPKESYFLVRPDVRKQIDFSYDAPVTTEWWDDDGSEEYKTMFARIEREGMVMFRE